jgi:hypothetical protein
MTRSYAGEPIPGKLIRDGQVMGNLVARMIAWATLAFHLNARSDVIQQRSPCFSLRLSRGRSKMFVHDMERGGDEPPNEILPL